MSKICNIWDAMQYATLAHKNQKRKYTQEPYIVHPFAVAGMVMTVTDDQDMIKAALLHDTVEDTDTTLEDINNIFGPRVRSFVYDLTDVATKSDGDRQVRAAINRKHLVHACPEAQTIKLADICNNVKDIQFDPAFADTYLMEKKLQLEILTLGDKRLHTVAKNLITAYYIKKQKENNLTKSSEVDILTYEYDPRN